LFEENDKRRTENVREIRAKYGTVLECNVDGVLLDCWKLNRTTETRTKLATCKCHDTGCCTRKGRTYDIDHTYDNLTNWDVSRRSFCEQLETEARKRLPPPPGFLEFINLTYSRPPLASGSPQGELPFDPDVVQQHFFKAQAALALYAEGTATFTDGVTIKPTPTDPEYHDMMNALARRFAAALVRGGTFVVAGNGDSTMAGADNCYFDAFLPVLERQLKPLFAAARVDFQVRNCGHNGGFNSQEQLTCAGTMMGIQDADIVIISFPFVKPNNEEAVYELFVRRALASGALPNIGGNDRHRTSAWLIPPYAKYGVTSGPQSYGGYTTADYGRWWPSARGKAGWGRIGDGLCHATHTRSGSAAVHSRNWHPGPQGHQGMADRFAFLYMTAMTQALEMVKADIRSSKGKLEPLRQKYKGRDEVKQAIQTWPQTPVQCEASCVKPKKEYAAFEDRKSWDHPKPPGCQTLCPAKGMPTGLDTAFPVCLSALQPVHGRVKWADWLVPDLSEGHDMIHEGPFSSLGPTGWSSMATLEAERNESQCVHHDRLETVAFEANGKVALRIPRVVVKRGIIGSCVICGDKESVGTPHPWDARYAPLVEVQAGDGAKPYSARLDWLDNQTGFEFDAGLHGAVTYPKKSASCWTLADLLDCATSRAFSCDPSGKDYPAVDPIIHIRCPKGMGGVLQYFWVW